jgi:hypothetical protein
MNDQTATPAPPQQGHGHLIALTHLERGQAEARCQCGAASGGDERGAEEWIAQHRREVGLLGSEQIEQAIDRVEAARAEPQAQVEFRIDIPVFAEPVTVDRDGYLVFGVPPAAQGPSMFLLLYDEMRWRAIILPPDSVWRMSRIEPEPAAPKLWTPGDKIQ